VIVSLVAAVADDGVIGRDGEIPWHLPEDLARFKELTTGHAVVMGRKTWDSLPDRVRPLPGRRNVVVTRTRDWHADGAERVGSIREALDLLAKEQHVFVIGGAEIYTAALPYADELVLTEVELDAPGDAFFPDWDRDTFREDTREEHTSADGTAFAFTTYRRPGGGATAQLRALASVSSLLACEHIDHWLFGGWAVDFHAGRITRPHTDVDLAVWLDDAERIAGLLDASDWRHAPEPEEDGGTGFERGGVRVELTYLTRRNGRIVVPLRDGEAAFPDGAFGRDERTLHGVSTRVIALSALLHEKSSTPRDEPQDATKDAADAEILSRL
jgi:dihydrofolate reductase